MTGTNLSEEIINRWKETWQIIKWRMNVHRINPEELAYRTRYSQDLIERGVKGETVPITLDFLQNCVNAFNLTSSRAKFFEENEEMFTEEYCISLLKPPPEMPPRQGNFWEYD